MSTVQTAPRRRWLAYALTTVALWGVWGALAGLSAQRGFPDTLVYGVWALTMVPPALFILWRANWRLDRSPRAMAYGMAIGLLGAGGQMLLFKALTLGPAYFIFPIISLSPVITIDAPITCATRPFDCCAISSLPRPFRSAAWGGNS